VWPSLSRGAWGLFTLASSVFRYRLYFELRLTDPDRSLCSWLGFCLSGAPAVLRFGIRGFEENTEQPLLVIVPESLRFKLFIPVLKNRFRNDWLWCTYTFMGLEIKAIVHIYTSDW
jgi:hypothetical protein